MHNIEPYYNWLKYYDPAADERSPFYGKQYNFDVYSETIYGYYIDPAWDGFGSETLYLKILYADYLTGFAVIEFIGEWNDAINNDIMTLKRNILELMIAEDINKFILIGENILNYHGSDDSYYEECLRKWEKDGLLPYRFLNSFRMNSGSITSINTSTWEEPFRSISGERCAHRTSVI